MTPLTRAAVLSAHDLISPFIHYTPVLTSRTLSALSSPHINLLFKCENLQKIGAFKIRGATHALARLSDNDVRNGVITHSSGNHAQALAFAAAAASRTRGFPIPAYVIMPRTSTPSKVSATRGYNAEVTFSGPTAAERESVMREVQARTSAVFVPPYDHPNVILGQGTVAVEFVAQAETLRQPLDAIMVPCGGGGLLSGVAVACAGTGVLVYGAEPEGADDCWRGLKEGRRIESVHAVTIADGLRTPVGVANFEVIRDKDLVRGVYTVGEEEIKSAMRLVLERMKVVIEPSSAVPVAVALFNEEFRREMEERAKAKGGVWNLGIVFSGGNTTVEKIIELFGEK